MKELDEMDDETREKILILAGTSLVREWLNGEDVTETFDNPKAERLIIAATINLTGTGYQKEWLLHIANSDDQRRRDLALRCFNAMKDFTAPKRRD